MFPSYVEKILQHTKVHPTEETCNWALSCFEAPKVPDFTQQLVAKWHLEWWTWFHSWKQNLFGIQCSLFHKTIVFSQWWWTTFRLPTVHYFNLIPESWARNILHRSRMLENSDCQLKLQCEPSFFFIVFQSKIAVLLGERKGLQTTHSDLIRRIKMLEYALRQERIKFHRLKFGCDPPTIDMTQSPDESGLGANEIAAGKLFAGMANSLVQSKLNYAFQMASTHTVQ